MSFLYMNTKMQMYEAHLIHFVSPLKHVPISF